MGLRSTSVAGLASALALAGCASDGGPYPSLALREAEKRPLITATAPVVPAAPAQPADLARITALRQQAETAAAAFTKQQPATATLVARARGRGAESDARARALVALADLIALRSTTFMPLGELDRLAADAAATYGETAPITAAQAEVLALLERQDAALDALWRELGQ